MQCVDARWQILIICIHFTNTYRIVRYNTVQWKDMLTFFINDIFYARSRLIDVNSHILYYLINNHILLEHDCCSFRADQLLQLSLGLCNSRTVKIFHYTFISTFPETLSETHKFHLRIRILYHPYDIKQYSNTTLLRVHRFNEPRIPTLRSYRPQ